MIVKFAARHMRGWPRWSLILCGAV